MLTGVDPQLLDATQAVLVRNGFGGLSLERVAEQAGRSRVTLWRQGITKEDLVGGLLQRLADDYRRTFWPIMDGDGTGREQVGRSLRALFDVADRHLDLLAVSDEVFHWATESVSFPSGSEGFLAPFVGALRTGAQDGSFVVEAPIEDAADVLFNAACWGYVHLRHRHGWGRRRARARLTAVLLPNGTG